ncbi:hypothetical protein F0A16_11630 [Salinicola corii]|uniref:Uncharacterized protein n=1 Tax=Salinicola corii TaxID=2606937 RepID=A0A640WED7_9GAMM|nr:hypothetical protein [Salinicola corii]KAA0018350.1 hypothetical protein F0A16_11630 [Salinicola corii]
MSQFPEIDKLNEVARKARDKCEDKLRATLPPGTRVEIKSGPEWLGPYEVQEYGKFSYGAVQLKNPETGVERRAGYQQVRKA